MTIAETQALSGFHEFIRIAGEIAGIFLVGLVVGLVGAFRRQRAGNKWTPAREKKFVEKHSNIHELLTELRVTVRASRAVVFQFHNGGNFVDGGSIKRFSVTHESCEMGISALLLDSQDVLLTKYTDMISLMETKPSKILSVSSLSHSAFRSALEINNVEFFTIAPLKCDDGITPLGFLCCHWCSSDSLDEIEREGISKASVEELVAQTTHNINSYLTYSTGIK